MFKLEAKVHLKKQLECISHAYCIFVNDTYPHIGYDITAKQ